MYKYVYRKKSTKKVLGRAIFDLSVVFCRLFSLESFPLSSFLTKCFSPEANWVRKIGLNAISFFFFVYSLIPLFYFIQQFQWWQIASVPSHNITGFFREKKSFIRDVFEEWNYSRNKGGNEPERLPKEHTVLFGCLPYSDGAYIIVKSVKTNFFLSFHLHHFHVRCPPRPSLGPWLILQSLTPS